MAMMYHENEEEAERRYDPETLHKVTALAARLQKEHQEMLTASDMESIGMEVGLEPAFIRQALAQHIAQKTEKQMEEERREQETVQAQVAPVLQTQTVTPQQTAEQAASEAEFWATVTAFTLPLFLGTFAYAFKFSPGIMTLFTLIMPAPLIALMGFLSGNRRVGFTAAVALILALAPTFPYLLYSGWPGDSLQMGDKLSAMFTYALFGIPAAGWIGSLGASLRERHFPSLPAAPVTRPEVTETVSRPEMQSLFADMQAQMESQRLHRAFLSVDVVNALEMKHAAADVTVDHAFSQNRRWIEEVVRACDGRLQGVLAEGLTFTFTEDAAAVRAARRLQEGLPAFNTAFNRLPVPFRLRCGISAGAVAAETVASPAYLRNPVVEWAAILQQRAEPGDILVSGEVAASALVELGHLAPLPESLYGATAFSWRAGQRAAGIETMM